MSAKVFQKLYQLLSGRIPPNRIELMPGIHWVWNSLCSKALKLSMLMILSGHVVDYFDIKCRSKDESLLYTHQNVVNTASFIATEDYNGSYLVFSSKRY